MRFHTLFFFLFTISNFAHGVNAGESSGFLSGFKHPLFGTDHVIAMVAVGIWGAFLGKRERIALPVVFPLIMSVGAVLGILGVNIPAVEIGIALSGVCLGALILFKASLPIPASMLIVGFFAIFHGYAHGVELPEGLNAFNFCAGFVIATGLLHIAGILIGMLNEIKYGEYVTRTCGALIMVLGLFYLKASI